MKDNLLTGSRLLLLNIALGLGTFIQILDTSIANVAIPYIAGSLAVSANQGTWVITSFAASNAIVLPLTGWLSDYFGKVKLFVYSVFLFSLTSFLCGLATDLTLLVFFRVLQGAVAGSLIPLSQSLIVTNNPPEKRGAALGFWSMIVVVAPVVGPILGGYLTEEYSWPWIFYINVPIGIFSGVMVALLLSDRESEIVRNPIDWTGLFLLSIGVACLQVMLDKGEDLDWFDSHVICILGIVSLIAISYFIVWTFYQPYPIVSFKFFAYRNFTLGTIITTLGYLAFFASTVVVPLWLQTAQGYTAYRAGLAVAPIGIFPVLLSFFIGQYLHSLDLRLWTALCFALFSLGFFIQAHFISGISIQHIMFVRLIQGIGLALFFIPLVQLSLGNIPNEEYARASGLFNFIRILVGSGFGTSLSVALWDRLEIFHHGRLTELATSYHPAIAQLYEQLPHVSTAFTRSVIDQALDRQIAQQSHMLATNDLSWIVAWTFICMVPILLFCKPVHKRSTDASQSVQH
ncbi:DHA2 family efflux MFS transporter permease subunit [Parachlamydia sp. AcF125]|uniref:DHA2 family efflux MFS transporter permease subunit n=1 Tax=Parachlamydia sp. AcF125 TaxID=2795736 RepID=UPI001BC90A48|nr:DHA2 family efflux MFS transporter permease subunit [Parachlamydia sp. AcF125]MBS4167660.1 Multidrug export protein EmrB [Parachlamydia sp. AcF125]